VSGREALLLVAAIGVTALLVGRLFTGALGGALFRRLDPAGAAASLLSGTAVLTLLSVILSGAGFPTRDLPLLVVALQLPFVWLCARRQRLDVLRPRGRPAEWALFLVPLTASSALGLLPVLAGGGFLFGNDTYTYGAFSEWLQGHAFSESVRSEAQSPVTGIPRIWQSQHYDLGIAHWLALVQAAVRPVSVLLVYPSVSTFGLVLLTASLWLAARQLLRLSQSWASATALVFALVPHALYWGHHNGFLQQGYALPHVLFGLVLLARVSARRQRTVCDAAHVALPFAFMASVYLPLLPLLGFAAAFVIAPLLWRERTRGGLRRFLVFLATVAAFMLLFAARDVLSALSPLHGFATSVAGGHVPWKPMDFVQFALGTRVLAPGWVNVEVPPFGVLNRLLAPLYAALVLAGAWYAARRARTRPLLAAAGLIALGALYFAFLVDDPWTGTRGHTWNLFKLAQWAWPFVLLLAVLAVRCLAPRRRGARAAVLALAFALPVSQLGVHLPWSVRLASAMREILPGTTLAGLAALKLRVQSLPAGTLLLLGRPVNAHRWLATAISLLAYPRAVVGDWSDSASVANADGGEALYSALLERWNEPHVVPILAGYVPFQPDRAEELGGGMALLPHAARPVVVHVVNPTGLTSDAESGRASFTVGRGRTKIVVFSPRAQSVQLVLELEPYPGRPGTTLRVYLTGEDYSHRSVRLASEGAPVAAVRLGGETSLRVVLDLPRGLATLVLVLDEGRGELDAREPISIVGLSLQPAPPAASAVAR
jgi:hypothetical protein